MVERLIFLDAVELEATCELLTDNWPMIGIYRLGDLEGTPTLEIRLDAPIKIFFKWAYTCQNGEVLLHCFNLSLELFDPPAYMLEAIREIRAQKLLSG
jgi:hypothetical protein